MVCFHEKIMKFSYFTNFTKSFCCFIERRLIQPHEFPLLLRVRIGPYEDVAKFQVMELKFTSEIKFEVAQFLRFTYAECRAIVDMFYEEEEREIERIKRK